MTRVRFAADFTRAAVAVLVASLLVLAGAATASAAADDSKTAKPKASSFAPHPTKRHVYGTPIAKPILHKRKKHTRPPAPATGQAAPIK